MRRSFDSDDSGSISGKDEFDDLYETLKPSPFNYSQLCANGSVVFVNNVSVGENVGKKKKRRRKKNAGNNDDQTRLLKALNIISSSTGTGSTSTQPRQRQTVGKQLKENEVKGFSTNKSKPSISAGKSQDDQKVNKTKTRTKKSSKPIENTHIKKQDTRRDIVVKSDIQNSSKKPDKSQDSSKINNTNSGLKSINSRCFRKSNGIVKTTTKNELNSWITPDKRKEIRKIVKSKNVSNPIENGSGNAEQNGANCLKKKPVKLQNISKINKAEKTLKPMKNGKLANNIKFYLNSPLNGSDVIKIENSLLKNNVDLSFEENMWTYYAYSYLGKNGKRFLDFKDVYLNTSFQSRKKKPTTNVVGEIFSGKHEENRLTPPSRPSTQLHEIAEPSWVKIVSNVKPALIFEADQWLFYTYAFGGENFNSFQQFKDCYFNISCTCLEANEENCETTSSVNEIPISDIYFSKCLMSSDTATGKKNSRKRRRAKNRRALESSTMLPMPSFSNVAPQTSPLILDDTLCIYSDHQEIFKDSCLGKSQRGYFQNAAWLFPFYFREDSENVPIDKRNKKRWMDFIMECSNNKFTYIITFIIGVLLGKATKHLL